MSSNSKPSVVHLADLPVADLQAFRQHPVAEILLRSIRLECDGAVSDCCSASAKGDHARAAWSSGFAMALRSLGDQLLREKDPEPVAQDDTFADPALKNAKSKRLVTL